jgi:Rab5 GDP/GTP exchange factor
MRLTIPDKYAMFMVVQFISVKMRECDIWKDSSDAEFEKATEGIEQLVMKWLYE